MNDSNLAKTYLLHDKVTQQPWLRFHLKDLIYIFCKEYLEKPTIAISSDSGPTMEMVAIRFLLASYKCISAGILLLATSSSAIKNRNILIAYDIWNLFCFI